MKPAKFGDVRLRDVFHVKPAAKAEDDHLFSCGVEIVDESNFAASITLWGENAIQAAKEFVACSVIAFCPAYLNAYNGILYSLTA